ncbi:PKD domain-containing protein [Neolewinella agarilytica]|uniref:Gliding motility-associated C-terminal domain-containing protein n=1 Tax=Neolewinella agarilytica TaxID=478744 RepID=A0A1H9C7K4_9BACT|nr:PKD domain-containing protein [Neolewinella agarilytica]SEP96783.1 gliding motility-associated C-terminal domain-containing protein [Neolewinella agarilytica]
MKPIILLRTFALLFFIVPAASTSLCGQEDVTFTYLDQDDFFFCLEDTTQTIQITPDPARTLTELTIIWILGETEPFVVSDVSQLTHTFTYPARDILEMCNYDDRFGCTGLCFTTQVLATYADSENPENVSRTVTYRKPPELSITGGGTYCLGQTARLTGGICPNNDPTAEDLIWTLPDGTEIRNEGTIEFPITVPGTFTFQLANANECGSGSTSTTITVIEAPEVAAVADSNVTVVDSVNYQLCFEESAVVRINSSASVGLTGRTWSVNRSGATIFDRNDVITRVEFDRPGDYVFTLRGSNENCDLTDEASFTIRVIPADVLEELRPQADECISLSYTPDPFNPAAIYEVDNVVVDNADFPIDLGIGLHTVFIQLPTSDCPAPPQRDTFSIVAEATATISTPDTTLCDQAMPLTFSATPAEGGIWTIDGMPFDGTIDPSSLDGGTYTIAYGNDPCLVSDQSTLTILETSISVPGLRELCIDQAPVDFSGEVTPAGGVFSGTAITAAGVFDPDLSGLGTFTITYSFRNPADTTCQNSETFSVEVSELTASFTTGDCDGNEVCFNLPAGVNYDRVSWDFGGLGTSDRQSPCFRFPGQGTYSVSLTAFRGPCEETSVREITIAEAPDPAFRLDADPTGCSELLVTIMNNSNGGGDLNYDWQLNGETFSTEVNPGVLTLASVLQDSVFSIGLTLSNACEENSTPIQTITTRPQPAARFGTNRSIYCSGDTVLISNNSIGQADTYRWTLDGVMIGNDSVPPFLMPESDEGTQIELCLFTTNVCGNDTLCQDIRIVPSDVNALFNVSPSTVCAGDTVRFRNLATNGVDVLYDFGNGQRSTATDPTTVYETPGVYRISQRAFGCGSDEFIQEITVLEVPEANFNAEVGCPGIPVRFSNNSDPDLRSSWDFGDGSPGVEAFSPDHTFPAPGSYTVCLTVSPILPEACEALFCQVVRIAERPVAGFMATDSVCLGEVVTVSTLATGDGLSCRYVFDDGNLSDDCSAENRYLEAGSYSVTQIVRDSRGCEDSLTLPVFVRPLPEPDFSPLVMNACAPDTLRFQNNTPAASSYLWDFGDGSSSMATSPMHTFTDPGTYQTVLTATGPDGLCTASVEQEIVINEMPRAIIQTAATELCLGEGINLANISTGTVSDVRWDLGDGTTSFENNPQGHQFLAAGEYTVSLFINNNDLCTDSTSVPVTVHPPVVLATAERRNILCHGDNTGLLRVDVSSGLTPYSFSWSNQANAATNTDLVAGAYRVTVTDANQCEAVLVDSILQPPPIVASPEISTVTCAGGNDGAITLAAAGGVGPYRIDWPGGTASGTIFNLAAGEYPVTITDNNDCTVERTITLPENPPIVILDSIVNVSCFGEQDGVFALRDLSGGVGAYQLSLTGTDYQQSGTTITRFDGLGPDVYTFKLTDALGCFEQYEVMITEPDEVLFNIFADTVFLSLGESVLLDNRFNANDPTFLWTPGSGLSCTDCERPRAQPTDPLTTYAALLTDRNGCTARDSVTAVVSIDREVYIPNTFTPNQDGRNDLFRIRSEFPLGIDTIESFQIFDRWGQVVFEQREFPPNDPAYGWDGRKNGEMVQLGIYVYQVVVRYFDQEKIVLSGKVELLR